MENLSKEDIVKMFDLPERKSKIDTIFKMKGNAPVYCVCHSTDISGFMICCEKCEEWYHGACISMKEQESKYIKKWYCTGCIEKYQLEIVYFSNEKKSSTDKKKKEKRRRSSYDEQESSLSENCRSGQSSNFLQNDKRGNKGYILEENLQKRGRFKDPVDCSKEPTHEVTELNYSVETRNKLEKRPKSSGRIKEQCMGPKCVKPAATNSKYCSEECGMTLAKLRLLSIIPYQLMKQAENPCVADQLDRDKLDNIRMKKKLASEALQKLQYKEMRLLELITRAKQVPILETKEEIDDESKTYCLLCGWEIPCRSAVRHMEMCFKKFESQSAFTEPIKANTDCNIFCEYYDSEKKTYCKRLRFICPDHYKPEKVEENEVCGCPMVQIMAPDIFSGPQSFCQNRKKSCELHYNWEVLARSEIDLDRLRQWHKFSELAAEEAVIQKQLANRSGVLNLLLHSTEQNTC